MNLNAKICILGGGISGLSCAYYLKNKGYNNVTIYEENDIVGGKCHSIQYKGKTYELGGTIALPCYNNLLSLLSEFGIKPDGSFIKRSYYDVNGNVIPQLKEEEISEFKKEYRILPDILRKYSFLKEDDYKSIPEELNKPFSAWCKINNLNVIKEVISHSFTSFGYGDIENIAAYYVLKAFDFNTINSFIEITPILNFKSGIQNALMKVADSLDNVKLAHKVIKITEQDNKLLVETEFSRQCFDYVISTISPLSLLNIFNYGKDIENLFNQIKYENFYVYGYKVSGLPELCGYIPDNLKSQRCGHLMLWNHRKGYNDLTIVYAKKSDDITENQATKLIENDLEKLGGKDIELYIKKKWLYFPHVDCDSLNNKFYEKIEALQGKRNVFYAGEIMGFSNMEGCVTYSKNLIRKYF